MVKRAAVLVALFATIFPSVASAMIVVDRGMFGVSMGATMKHVRSKLGSPSRVERSGTDWLYRRRHLTLLFDGPRSRLSFLSTTSPGQRTVRGVGVGSTKQDVLRYVAGVRCGPPHKSGTDCLVFSEAATVFGLGPDTEFRIGSTGVVDEVDISVY
jgi:hypothetical protein